MMKTDYYVKTRELAGKAGVTIPALCDVAGISRGAPWTWSGGKSAPNTKTWNKVKAASKALIAKRKAAEQ